MSLQQFEPSGAPMLNHWRDALYEAICDLALTPQGADAVRRDGSAAAPPADVSRAASIVLTSDDEIVVIGLGTDDDHAPLLAKAFLGLGAEEAVDQADVEDALCEMVNILAGVLKRRTKQTFTLGIPSFTRIDGDRAERLAVRVGSIPAVLFLTSERPLERSRN